MMELVSKIYVGLIEFILLLLFAIPLALVVLHVAADAVDPNNMVEQFFGNTFGLVLSLLVYYLFLVLVFGLLSISISNYQNLNRIADLLETQAAARKMQEPRLTKQTKTDARREEPSISIK